MAKRYPIVILVKNIENMVFACKHAGEMMSQIQRDCGIFDAFSASEDNVFYNANGGPTPSVVKYHNTVLSKDVFATVYEDRFGAHIFFGPAKKVWTDELNIFEMDVELDADAARDPWAIAHAKEVW